MNDSLKVLENLTELLYSELKVAVNNSDTDDKTHKLLKEAMIDSINLKRKIELARAWSIKQ